jgi:endonuclease/exonuclease/phosphatase family metal-dependent hydrolase
VALVGAGPHNALRVTVDLAGQPVDIVGLHLRWPITPAHAATRELALARLARLARQAPRPLVLVGDFNLTPHDGAFERLLANGGLVNAAAASGLVTTWPASAGGWSGRLPGLQIDHCLVTHGIRAESFVLGPWVGSDHRPVLVRLEVPVRLNAPAEGRSTSRP